MTIACSLLSSTLNGGLRGSSRRAGVAVVVLGHQPRVSLSFFAPLYPDHVAASEPTTPLANWATPPASHKHLACTCIHSNPHHEPGKASTASKHSTSVLHAARPACPSRPLARQPTFRFDG